VTSSPSDPQNKADLDTYVRISKELIMAGADSPGRTAAVLADHGFSPEEWNRESDSWGSAIRRDPVLRDRFHEIYSDPSPRTKETSMSISVHERTPYENAQSAPVRPRSWVWLLIGAALLPFTLFQTVIPGAAWLAPAFLMRFVRTQRARVALPAIAIVGYAAVLVAIRGFFAGADGYTFAAAGISLVIPFGFDRWLAPRLGRFARSMVFPSADTAASFLASFAGFGTLGLAANSQVGNHSLTKLVAVTGVFGLSFLISWTASAVNDLWEHDFRLTTGVRVFRAWLAVLIVVLVAGGAWVGLTPAAGGTVPVAGLAPSRATVEAFQIADIPHGRLSAEARAEAHDRYLEPLITDLFTRTGQVAEAGARMVVWSEAAAFVYKEDEAGLIDRARATAIEHGIYLQIGIIAFLPTDESPFNENRAIMIDPAGEILWDYHKATVPLNDGNAPGPGVIPVADTPFGRIATVICFDADFPGLVRQAGKAGVDILLVPSSDFGTVGETHARAAILRAVENGTALFRPTRIGVSVAVDHNGRQLGYQDDYASGSEQTMWAILPTEGERTLYSILGDGAGWASVLGIIGLTGAAVVRKRDIQDR